MENIITLLEKTIKTNGDRVAVRDPQKTYITYNELYHDIKHFHFLWSKLGLQKGDKIAICSRNCIEWIELYFAAVTGGYIAALLPSNFASNQISELISHSDSTLLYIEESLATQIDFCSIPNISVVFGINTKQIYYSSVNVDPLLLHNGNSVFSQIEPFGENNLDDVCTIIYTSGSTGSSKGVMLSIKNLSFDVSVVSHIYSYNCGDNYVSLLPFSHIYPLICEVLTSICNGLQIVICSKIVPSYICGLFEQYKPRNITAVPALLYQLIDYVLGNELSSEENQLRLSQNTLEAENYSLFLRNKLIHALGGQVQVFATGGAPVSETVETLLVSKLKFPYISGYGMSECFPLALGIVGNYQLRSCGKIPVEHNVRIKMIGRLGSQGEIQVKDDGVFVGYYKDIIATKAAFTEDGWLHTGDVGFVDKDRSLFITGRIKNMLISSNGENINPEDIEYILNSSLYILESILVQRGEKLYAIVVPDRDKAEADGIDAEELDKKIDEAVREASKKLPGFTIISGFELRDEPLERTPKGSLKRYLYSDGIKEN